MAHHPHCGVAGPDAAEHPTRGNGVDRRMRSGRDRSRARSGYGDPRPDANPRGARRSEGHRGVHVGPDHLAVGEPEIVEAEFLGEHGVVEVGDLAG